MLSERELSAAIGSTAYGPDGDKIGTVEHFFTDDRTGAPTWVAISTGLFGTRHSVVPAAEATFGDGRLHLPVTKEAVRTAPQVGGEHLDPADEEALRRHYTGAVTEGETRTTDAAAAETQATQPAPVAPPAPVAQTAPVAQAAPVAPQGGATGERGAVPPSDGAMTRSEEQVRVGTEQVAATRVRLVKYVVTEEVQVTVPVRREEIRVEHVPLDAPDEGPGESLAPAGDAEGTPSAGRGLPDEIVLHAERPVVSVEVVPVERVRLRTEVVQGQERVTDQVQREEIVVDRS
jgi:Domain of unknown function (DUF2382)/PRC-barrel domain